MTAYDASLSCNYRQCIYILWLLLIMHVTCSAWQILYLAGFVPMTDLWMRASKWTNGRTNERRNGYDSVKPCAWFWETVSCLNYLTTDSCELFLWWHISSVHNKREFSKVNWEYLITINNISRTKSSYSLVYKLTLEWTFLMEFLTKVSHIWLVWQVPADLDLHASAA
jgi:hypothetical protein